MGRDFGQSLARGVKEPAPSRAVLIHAEMKISLNAFKIKLKQAAFS